MRKAIPAILLIISSLFMVKCQREVQGDIVNKPQLDEFINYTLDGVDYELGTGHDSLAGFVNNPPTYDPIMNQVSGYRAGTPDRLVIYFIHPLRDTAGSYPVRGIHVQQYRSAYPQPSPPIITITMNRIPAPTSSGGYFEGSILGNFIDTSSVMHSLKGIFRVKKR